MQCHVISTNEGESGEQLKESDLSLLAQRDLSPFAALKSYESRQLPKLQKFTFYFRSSGRLAGTTLSYVNSKASYNEQQEGYI